MSKHHGFVHYGLRWNVKDIMNYVIIRKFYDLGTHQHFIQKIFNLITTIHLLTLNQCTMSHNSLFFITITLHKRELHPEREYTINKNERLAQRRDQSRYIEVAHGDIFMEQKMIFELVLGQSAILKKKVWADYEQLFHVFMGKKKLNKKLHNISFIKEFF